MAACTVSDKLTILADVYDSSVEEMLEEYLAQSVVPGVCMNPDCDYTGEYEPDQREGWCDECGTSSVKGLLVLHGLI